MLTSGHAVEAGHAAVEVDFLLAQVEALGFAGAQAIAAFCAGILIEGEAEGGPLGDVTQERSDGAKRVAVEATTKGCHDGYDREEREREDESSDSGPRKIDAEECVDAESIGGTYDEVVSRREERAENGRGDAPEIAVGIEKRNEEAAPAEHGHGNDRSGKHALAQTDGGRGKTEKFRGGGGGSEADENVSQKIGYTCDGVLKEAERAQDGAIDATEAERHEKDEHCGGAGPENAGSQGD